MYALSPESLQSNGSPQAMGANIPQSHQQPYYTTPGSQQQYFSSPPFDTWSMPNIHSPPDYGFNHPQPGGQSIPLMQQDHGSGYPPHARSTTLGGQGYPPMGNNASSGGMHSTYHSTMGVNPTQVLDTSGRNLSGGGQAGARPKALSEQVSPQGRPMIQPRKNTQTMNGGVRPSVQSNTMDPRVQAAYRAPARIAPTAPVKKPESKKRKVIEEDDDSEEDSDGDYLGDGMQPLAGGSQGQLPGGRLPGACGPCKRLKMKCLFPEGENVCQRCRNSGRSEKCIVGPRKPRQPSNKKELLLQKLREQDNVIKQKDAIMKSLIEQLQDPNKGLTLKEPRVSPSISSSAIDSQSKVSREEPAINKEILEWVERAKASVTANPGYRMYDGRGAYDSDSPTESSPASLLSPTKSNLSDSGRSASYLAAPGASGGRGSAKSSPKLLTLPLESTPLGLLADLWNVLLSSLDCPQSPRHSGLEVPFTRRP